MYRIITFQCYHCGIVVKVFVRDNKKLSFSIIGNLHSENECVNKFGYFKCIHCNKIDTTKRFEKVYN